MSGSPLPISDLRIQNSRGTVMMQRVTDAAQTAAMPGETFALYDGPVDYQATAIFPDATKQLWIGSTFFMQHDTLVLRENDGRVVATYSY
jgi:hypothetical protein